MDPGVNDTTFDVVKRALKLVTEVNIVNEFGESSLGIIEEALWISRVGERGN